MLSVSGAPAQRPANRTREWTHADVHGRGGHARQEEHRPRMTVRLARR
jgi:hypothetical protein